MWSDPNEHEDAEDAVTAHARVTATALANQLDVCAAADAFLSQARQAHEPTERTDLGPTLKLQTTDDACRVAILDPATADERWFQTLQELREHVRTAFVRSFTVRREGWTVPDPQAAGIPPDSARLILHGSNPVVDVVTVIAMNGTLADPHLRHNDAVGRMVPFDHAAHDLTERGIRYLASLFRLPETCPSPRRTRDPRRAPAHAGPSSTP